MTRTYRIDRRVIDPISSGHWAGGDTVVEAEMRAGGYPYWTVVEVLPGGSTMAAGEGRRYDTLDGASREMDRLISLGAPVTYSAKRLAGCAVCGDRSTQDSGDEQGLRCAVHPPLCGDAHTMEMDASGGGFWGCTRCYEQEVPR